MLMMRPERCFKSARLNSFVNKKVPLQVDVQHGVPIRFAHAHEQAVLGDAGVVHQNVHVSRLLQNLPGGGFHAGRFRNVGGHSPGFASELANFRNRFLHELGLQLFHSHDVGAVGGQVQRDGATDARPARSTAI